MKFLGIASPFVLLGLRIVSLIVYTLTVIAAFGGRFDPHIFTLPSMLSLVLTFLAILTLILIIIWAVWRKYIFAALGVLAIVMSMSSLKEVMPIGSKKEAQPGEQTFTIMSWNVLHTDDIRHPEYNGNRAIEYIVNSGVDVVCVTELYGFNTSEVASARKSTLDSLNMIYPYSQGNGFSDITIISKYPVERTGYSFFDKGYHRFDFYKIDFPNDKSLTVGMLHLYSFGLSEEERNVVTEINSVQTAKTSMKELKGSIYAKMKDAFRNRADNALVVREVLDSIPKDTPLIVCGDFNDVPSSWTYNLIRGTDMRDAYAETNIGPGTTYNLHMFYFHIDQMLYRGPLNALSLDIGKIDSSDHYPLIGTFSFTN